MAVADAALAFFHHAFDYPVKTESQTLEHIGPYATHMPFVADSHLRPDGYGSLDQQLFQSMPLSAHKYSRFSPNPNFDYQAYVGPFLLFNRTLALDNRPPGAWLVTFFIEPLVSSSPTPPSSPLAPTHSIFALPLV